MRKFSFIFLMLLTFCFLMTSCDEHEHNWNSYDIIKEATCTEEGQLIYHCDLCDETKEEVISPKGHNIVVDDAVGESCENNGLTEGKHCSVCKEIILPQETILASGHKWDDGEITLYPTCEEKGNLTFTCEKCELTKVEYIEETGHTYNISYEWKAFESCVASAKCETCEKEFIEQATLTYVDNENIREYTASFKSDLFEAQKKNETLHQHDYKPSVTLPTCTEGGYTIYICECGDSYVDDEIMATGHTEVVDQAVVPTCTETGLTEGKHCSVCNGVLLKQETVKALGHTEVIDKAIASTCTETGLTEGKHCSVCNTVLVAQEIVKALGHTEVIDKAVASTCTETGLTEGKHCSVCNTILVAQEIVKDLGHTEVIDKAVASTCTETGLTEGKHCSVCNTILVAQRVVTMKSHSWDGGVITIAVSCMEDGLKTYTCSVCENTKTSIIKARGFHNYGERSYTWDFENLTVTGKCVCLDNSTHIHSETVEATMEIINPSTCNSKGLVLYTGAPFESVYFLNKTTSVRTEMLEHSEVTIPAINPTCTKTGLTEGKYCSECNIVLLNQETVKALGHTEVIDQAVAATCTETGLTEGSHCSTCNEILIGQVVISKLSHEWDAGNVTLQPTCENDGEKTFVCKNCDETKIVVLDAIGHGMIVVDSAVAPTCTKTGLTEGSHCYTCGKILIEQEMVPATGHNEVIDQAVAPTCTETGLTEGKRCGVCEQVLIEQEKIDIIAHNEVIDQAVAPTCTETGLTEGRHCSVCNTVLVNQEIVKALGHTEVIDQEVPATCTETGLTEGKHCGVCNECFIYQRVIPTLGHDEAYDEMVAPTCTETGLTEGYHCRVCDEVTVEQEIIPALGHAIIIDHAVEATCLYEGLTEGKHCLVCEQVLVEQQIIPVKEHIEKIDNAIAPTCTETGLTEGKRCSECNTIIVKQEIIDVIAHTEVIDKAVASTCTKTGLTEGSHCSVCSQILIEQDIVPLLEHTVEIINSILPTCTATGLTEGSYCSSCGETLVEQRIINQKNKHDYVDYVCSDCGKEYNSIFIENCNSRYGYNFFGTLPNGDSLQQFYLDLDNLVKEFHMNESLTATTISVNYVSRNLTEDEAITVWKTYKDDNPLYYWISTSVSIDGENLIIHVIECYSDGLAREEYNQYIYSKIEEYSEILVFEQSQYMISLALHDKIINTINYAYEADGVTPSDEHWAHSIVGVFEMNSGVCESYARTFQLLLNYNFVENVFVTGVANEESHAWNLVKLDNDEWYWFDLTWDDTYFNYSFGYSNRRWGIGYNWFAQDSKSSFESYHEYSKSTSIGVEFLYDLPEVSSNSIEVPNMLGDIIEVDGFKYEIVGYNSLELIYVSTYDASVDLVIFDTINYKRREYEVISINTNSGQPIFWLCKDLYLPSTLKFIWDFALNGSMENIYISDENQYFTSLDGVLFTKNLNTLIQYPMSNPKTEYFIPDETENVAYYAFRSSSFENTKLEKLVLGDNISVLGLTNWGNGYDVLKNNIGDQWLNIYNELVGDKIITVSDENPYYIIENGGIYNSDKTTLYWVMQDVEEFVFAEEVIYVERGAFAGCGLLEKITIPDKFTSIGAYMFVNCTSLVEVIIPDSVTVIEFGAFSGCSSLEEINIPNTVTSIEYKAFLGCSLLKRINIPDGVTSIRNETFSGCSSLEEITIPDTVTSIEYKAFLDCSLLKRINIPDGVTRIGSNTFSGCTSLVEIIIPNSITGIGSGAFFGCTSLAMIELPDNIESIGYAAFRDCSSLKEIVIPNKVMSIEPYTFYNCTSLETVVIPNSVTNIKEAAFGYCNGLKTIYYVGTEEEWNNLDLLISGNEDYIVYFYLEENDNSLEGNYWYYDDNDNIVIWSN